MNKQIFWTTVALITAALGIPLASYAESKQAEDPVQSEQQVISAQTLSNVLKVGEYQATAAKAEQSEAEVIARIQPHEQAGHQAATLYVRNIPVITFTGDPVTTSSTKQADSKAQTKVATTGNIPTAIAQASPEPKLHADKSPVWRATTVAAKLNQLSQEQVDAGKITVKWQAGSNSQAQQSSESYLIAADGKQLVEINPGARLPDQANNLSEEALQVTNRLRRLIGNAPPLREVSGKPKPAPKQTQQIASNTGRSRRSGMASWYGPGFHGNRTANGEIYNQNALTAAHRSLPFGTKVRVTHVKTGNSVVVRINDRGPFVGGRVIDLSAAAARTVGVMQSGVAPVRLEILN